MTELSGAAILLVILLGGSALGVLVQPFLSEHHRSQETTDLIRLVDTMLVTFAALVLGLLTSSVKTSFDTVDSSQETTDLIRLVDTMLVTFAALVLGLLTSSVKTSFDTVDSSQETTDLIRLVDTMLVTFAALVLGLLTSSVKTSFDTVDNDLRSFSINLIQLDRLLGQYGSETDAARSLLRGYTAAAIASTWATEAKPPGGYYPMDVAPPSDNSIESVKLGDMLARIEIDLHQLDPADPMHRRQAVVILNQFEQLMRLRWRLIEEAHSSISMPFYIVLTFWLVILFASFRLSAPRNALSYITILLGALSIASVVYVILDLDTPFSGLFMVSSQPMREALAQLSR